MKSTQAFLVFIFFIVSIFSVSAQYGSNGYGNNGYGRSNQMNQVPNEPEKPKEVPVDEIVEKMMVSMKTAVNLDALQVIAISNVMKESMRQQGVLLKQITNQEDLQSNYKILVENTDRKVNEFLNPDQKEKYLAFKMTAPKPEKSKKKEKGKKNKKEEGIEQP